RGILDEPTVELRTSDRATCKPGFRCCDYTLRSIINPTVMLVNLILRVLSELNKLKKLLPELIYLNRPEQGSIHFKLVEPGPIQLTGQLICASRDEVE